MSYTRPGPIDVPETLARMPSWITGVRAEISEDVAFLSGAALGHLHLVVMRAEVPQALLRERLALRAAETCVAQSGRPERARDLRDAVQFLQAGASPGPAGEIYLSWQRSVERRVSVKALHRAWPDVPPEQLAGWLEAGKGGPVPRAAAVLEAVLTDRPRARALARLLADAALSQALGWPQIVPLLGVGLRRGDLGMTGEALRTACHRAIVAAAVEASREAEELTRRAARLREVAPKLRAKGAEDAVALFLSRDAVTPAALTSLRSDRAARRFCARLAELGAVRELTGRDTFRLYGV